MKIYAEKLPQQLATGLAPIYLVSGDEILLTEEASSKIRHAAIQGGYTEREIFDIDTTCNWEELYNRTNNVSLFSTQLLVELRLGLGKKINASNAKSLHQYLTKPPPNVIILIITGKLDTTQQKNAWFKQVDTNGIIIQIWPLTPTQFPQWLNKRLQSFGLSTDKQGLQLLLEHTAGNLLAASQEIEKLTLLYGKDKILTATQISSSITDNARFTTYNLIDAALEGKIEKLEKILINLKDTGIDPTLILWTIANELRILINISYNTLRGTPLEKALFQNNVRSVRQILIKQALKRHTYPQLLAMLQSAFHIDLMVKGMDQQRLLWHELSRLYWLLAGC